MDHSLKPSTLIDPQFPVFLDEVISSTTDFQKTLKNKGKDLGALWPKLAQGLGKKTELKHYSELENFVQAYTYYYMPANVMKWPRILREMEVLGLGVGEQGSWLDLGSGPGTAVLGALWYFQAFQKEKLTSFEMVAVDQSRGFLTQAQNLVSSFYKKSSVDKKLKTHQLDIFKNPKQVGDLLNQYKPRVCSMSNSLVESPLSFEEKVDWVSGVIEKMYDNQKGVEPSWFVIVEPGTQEVTRELLEIRKQLIHSEKLTGKFQVMLPCLSHRKCGALENPRDWCHEACDVQFPKWHEELGKEAGLRKEQILYSYLVLCVGGSQCITPLQFPKTGKRVVSQILKEKGLTKCFMCTENGKTLARVLDSKRAAENEDFFQLERGSICKSLNTDEKGSVTEIQLL